MRLKNKQWVKRTLAGMLFVFSSSFVYAGVVDANKAAFDSTVVLQFLMQTDGFDINKQNIQGQTLLHLAAKGGDVPAVRTLVQKGANVNLTDKKKQTALFYAIEYEHYEIAKYLIKHQSDVSIADINGNTPLHLYLEQTKKKQQPHPVDTDLKLLLLMQ